MPIAMADIQADQDTSSDVRNNDDDIWEELIAHLEACRAALGSLKEAMFAIMSLAEEMERVSACTESRLDNMDSIVTAHSFVENHSDHENVSTDTIQD
ncbi:hypothetical protein PHISCL_05920 [Aspergillus sclerotialis]|uniref:Uncharacterized protein n=1 Tax=Aspergillus sclerotialis TaxID=2070753 RepID=A0A3A2ZFH7_9EURO|nr:hypothetical protein PHISCL_05920 [Aspergillus sclerotialis]